jgi:CMP-N,N'-diacetyllegionaminic acid synthase
MKSLFLIPARGGSKGLPRKNIRRLNGKPLIHYAIEYARSFVSDEDICLSTDDIEIINCAGQIGLKPPFTRPAELADDSAGMSGVIRHALDYYLTLNIIYDSVVLLQPTSPLRKDFHYNEASMLFNKDIDMIVSVCRSKNNPYYNLFEEDENGFLKISKEGPYKSARQQAPEVYRYNGAIYIVNVSSFNEKGSLQLLSKVKKYIMEEEYSVDIDDDFDWKIAELLLQNHKDL